MLKKILTRTFIVILALFVLAFAAYFGMLGWEYLTGNQYVKYLKQNSETVGIDDTFTFEIADADIAASDLILVGEIHGTKTACEFDVDFFKHLYTNFGVRVYIAELDYVQAQLMNQFMQTGEARMLDSILQRWVVVQGRNNKDYYDKYKALQRFYQQLPADDKFTFVGIDKVQDWRLFAAYLDSQNATKNELPVLIVNSETGLTPIEERLAWLLQHPDSTLLNATALARLQQNLTYAQEKTNREEVMFQNFQTFYQQNNWAGQKLYGFFGVYHVFQYRVNGNHPLASKIRSAIPALSNKMLSFNFLLVDSHMVMDSKALPEFLRDQGKYTRMALSADNIFVMYLYGIQDFKRMTPAHSKSLIRMNASDNPYANTARLNKTFQLLPVTELFEMNDKDMPYVQYTIFGRNADWAEPLPD